MDDTINASVQMLPAEWRDRVRATLQRLPADWRPDAVQEAWRALLEGKSPCGAITGHYRREFRTELVWSELAPSWGEGMGNMSAAM